MILIVSYVSYRKLDDAAKDLLHKYDAAKDLLHHRH